MLVQAPHSSKQSMTTPLGNNSVHQSPPLFICRHDKTIPYLTYTIQDQDVNITFHCTNSTHTTSESYKSIKVKSKQQQRKSPEKRSKCIDNEHGDSVGYSEHEQEFQCHRCGKKNRHLRFPQETKEKEEDQDINVEYHCKHHPNTELSFYCNICQSNICSECKWTTHQTHHTFKVSDLLENTNISEWMKSIEQWEKWYSDDTFKKYKEERTLESKIEVNEVLFGIVKSCLGMFEKFKASYNINLYRNTANIAKNFNYILLKSLLNDTNKNTSTLNISTAIEYLSKQFILNITNIQFTNISSITTTSILPSTQPRNINPRGVKLKNTPFEEITTLEVSGCIMSIWKLNNSQFAVGCENPNEILIVDAKTLKNLRTLKHQPEGIWRMYIHKKSGNLISLSRNGSICFWDHSSGKWIKDIKGKTLGVRSIVEWNNGDIVTVCWSGFIKYWDMTEDKCYRTINNGKGIYDVILKDNKWITGESDGFKIFKEDAKSKEDCIYHNEWDGRYVLALWWVNDLWWVGCFDGCIFIYDVNRLEFQGEWKGHYRSIYSLIKLSNGSIASGEFDSSLKIWDWEAMECHQTLNIRGGIYNGWCEWDENSIISGSYKEKEIKMFIRK